MEERISVEDAVESNIKRLIHESKNGDQTERAKLFISFEHLLPYIGGSTVPQLHDFANREEIGVRNTLFLSSLLRSLQYNNAELDAIKKQFKLAEVSNVISDISEKDIPISGETCVELKEELYDGIDTLQFIGADDYPEAVSVDVKELIDNHLDQLSREVLEDDVSPERFNTVLLETAGERYRDWLFYVLMNESKKYNSVYVGHPIRRFLTSPYIQRKVIIYSKNDKGRALFHDGVSQRRDGNLELYELNSHFIDKGYIEYLQANNLHRLVEELESKQYKAEESSLIIIMHDFEYDVTKDLTGNSVELKEISGHDLNIDIYM